MERTADRCYLWTTTETVVTQIWQENAWDIFKDPLLRLDYLKYITRFMHALCGALYVNIIRRSQNPHFKNHLT